MESASRARWVISVLAILGTLPYITLKILWLSGSRVGLRDPDFGTSAVMQTANVVTMAMDVVAVAMALAFVTAWGRRIKPWLLLFPMWVGTGFLAPILVIVPLQLAFGTTSTESAGETVPIAEWVYATVYGGFMWQGLFLLTGFVLHARVRWSAQLGWSLRTPGRLVGGAELPRLIIVFALLAAGGLALVSHVYGEFRPQAVNVLGDAAMVVAAAVGLAMLAGLVGHRFPRWLGIALAWVGTGAMVSWSLYLGVVLLTPNDFQDEAGVAVSDVVAEAVRFVAGTSAAVTALGLVRRRAERQSGTPPRVPRQAQAAPMQADPTQADREEPAGSAG